MASRHQEVEEFMLQPVEQLVRDLRSDLGYEPPLFKPGLSAIQREQENDVYIVVEFTPAARAPYTIGGTMWQTRVLMTITLGVAERIPTNHEIHTLMKTKADSLVNYYSGQYCNDIKQLYVFDTKWFSQVETSTRTYYMVTVDFRYFEYPTVR